MGRLAIITHKFDKFNKKAYVLTGVLEEVAQRGIEIVVSDGDGRFEPADAAILHVDATDVDPEYLKLARRYPRVINMNVKNIRKRHISSLLVARDSSWAGPVIVKPDLNALGRPELSHNRVAKRLGHRAPHRDVAALGRYAVFDSARAVPDDVWRDGTLVVEKFVPEVDPRGYAMRAWVFMGTRERCTRYVARKPVIKAAAAIAREPSPVPPELREQRERLGFDYGKFDFIMHDGRAVLLDANKTPSAPQNLSDHLRLGARDLADGLIELMQQDGGRVPAKF